MNIREKAIQGSILAVVSVLGKGDIFPRVMDQIERVNEKMPDNTGEEKRAQFYADCEIIFDELVKPIARQMLNFLLEAALIYLSAQAKIDVQGN